MWMFHPFCQADCGCGTRYRGCLGEGANLFVATGVDGRDHRNGVRGQAGRGHDVMVRTSPPRHTRTPLQSLPPDPDPVVHVSEYEFASDALVFYQMY